MRRLLPFSLVFFVLTGIVYALQAIPITGIFLMMMAAMLWSVLLVNAGMIGIAIEAVIGRAFRLWLIVPIAFYGGYGYFAWADHAKLKALTTAYDAANAQVTIPFDPARHALVFESDAPGNARGGGDLTQNFGLPVSYTVRPGTNDYRSHRMVEQAVCTRVNENRALASASVWAFGVIDGDSIYRRKPSGFCMVSMPEQPRLPLVRVTHREEKIVEGGLPVTRVTTTVTMPDGRQYRLLGGTAAPLSWFPMPIMGCALNSGAPSWDCVTQFKRDGFTPIVTGDTRYGRDVAVLARVLGLKHIAPEQRKSGDPALVNAKIDAAEANALTSQLASLDAMIADPLAKVIDWQVGVIANRPEILAGRADAIMAGIERAAAATADDQRYKARESGRIMAGLIAKLPRERFAGFGPRLLELYAAADEKHWLWEAEPLIRRLGDLGAGAVPYLVNPRASTSNVNGAGVEGLCRVGPAARAAAEPALTVMWQKTRDFDRDERMELFVAMRRIGIAVPPLREDKRGQLDGFQKDWSDISPASPPRVCATRAEYQARREEKYGGQRRTNLE